MLDFVESLKQVVADVQVTGGAIVERSSLSPDLLQRLREYAVQQIAATEREKYALLEWFTEGFFGEYVRACAIHLCKLGITDDEFVYRLITRVIDLSLSGKYPFAGEVRDFEERLAASLFEVWDQMGDEQTVTYTFAQERWLIAWDYQKSQWKVTGLGRLLLELSPVQAAIFLLSIDTIFSTGKHDFRHISADVLRGVFRPQPDSDETPHLIPLHRGVLARLGILEEPGDYHPDRVRLTPVGKIVVDRVLSKDNPFRDAAKSLIESEALGDTFQGSSLEIEEVVRIVNSSDLVDDANRKSIARSAQLHQTGQYLDAVRLLNPSIEAVVNAMLVQVGEQPEHFRGLASKAQRLGQQNVIPADVSGAVEVFAARNKVLHGNFAPPADYVFPVCLLAFRYLRRLLTEYRPASANKA